MWIRPIILLSCALMFAGAANAQAPASPVTPPAQTAPPAAVQPTNCAPMPPRGSGTRDGTVGQSSEPLGDRLAKSDGTLCPPSGVDPEIRAPTPEGGKMRVIPPPGSPGGDPSLRPK